MGYVRILPRRCIQRRQARASSRWWFESRSPTKRPCWSTGKDGPGAPAAPGPQTRPYRRPPLDADGHLLHDRKMDEEKGQHEQHKQKPGQSIWKYTVIVWFGAAIFGMPVVNFVEARYECVDRLHWLALPKGEGDPPSPFEAFEPNVYDYLRCLF